MAASDDQLRQDEVEALLGKATAALGPAQGDSKYQLVLEPRSWCLYLRIIGTVLQPVPDEFHQRVADVVKRGGIMRAVVDVGTCTYISSAALGVLAEFLLGAARQGAQVVMLKPNDRIRTVMRMVGLDTLFLVVENEAMAMAYFASSEQAKRGG